MMLTHNESNSVRMSRRRGFTLIEILMSVLVLSIGLLGLAAVLPAVLKQQRDSSDLVMGNLAMDSAESFLRSGPTLAAGDPPVAPIPYTLDARYWSIFLRPAINPDTGQPWSGATPQTGPELVPENGEWYPVPMDGQGENSSTIGRDLALTGSGFSYVQRKVRISLADRLYPGDSSGAREPRFVWDIAVKRVGAARGNTRPVPLANQPQGYDRAMIALFVRRIDGRIRIPRTQTLMANLTDKTATAPDRRNPVSVDTNGVPTFDGRNGDDGAYSLPVTLNADFVPQIGLDLTEVRDTIVIDGDPQMVQLAGQIGQKLVDNLGNIYTVIGSGEGGFGVKVSPPVARGIVGSQGAGGNSNNPPPRITQVLFTPQIPAAVRVFEVTP